MFGIFWRGAREKRRQAAAVQMSRALSAEADGREDLVLERAADVDAGVEGLAHGFDGQLGGVAVAAEVSEDDAAQRRGAGAGGEVGGGVVGEVSVRGEDALFDRKRPFRVGLQ